MIHKLKINAKGYGTEDDCIASSGDVEACIETYSGGAFPNFIFPSPGPVILIY